MRFLLTSRIVQPCFFFVVVHSLTPIFPSTFVQWFIELLTYFKLVLQISAISWRNKARVWVNICQYTCQYISIPIPNDSTLLNTIASQKDRQQGIWKRGYPGFKDRTFFPASDSCTWAVVGWDWMKVYIYIVYVITLNYTMFRVFWPQHTSFHRE